MLRVMQNKMMERDSPIVKVSGLGHGELLSMHIQLVGGRWCRGRSRRIVRSRSRTGHRRGRHAVCADTWWSTVVVKRRGRQDRCCV